MLNPSHETDDAIAEIGQLFEQEAVKAQSDLWMVPMAAQLRVRTAKVAQNHKKAASICKRMGLTEWQAKHLKEAELHMELAFKLDSVVAAEDKARARARKRGVVTQDVIQQANSAHPPDLDAFIADYRANGRGALKELREKACDFWA